jgi:hypothetical protein
VHQMRVDRYVQSNQDLWRVECEQCGLAADGLSMNDAAQAASVLARRMCGAMVGTVRWDRSRRDHLGDLPLTDEQIVAMWARRERSDAPSAEAVS